MSESRRYKLLFKGPKDSSPETIKQLNSAFITRFGLTIQEADAVFKAAPVAMKRAAASAELTHYKEALEQAGASVEIVEDPGAVSGAIPVPTQSLSLSDDSDDAKLTEGEVTSEPEKKAEPLDLGLSLDDDEHVSKKPDEKSTVTTKSSQSIEQSSQLSLSADETEEAKEEEMDLSIPAEPIATSPPAGMSLSLDAEEEHTTPEPPKAETTDKPAEKDQHVVEQTKNDSPTTEPHPTQEPTEPIPTPAEASYKRRLEAKRAQRSFIISLLAGLAALGVFNFIYFGFIDVATDSDRVVEEEIGREEPTPSLAPLIKAAAQHKWITDKNCKAAELCGEIVIEEDVIIKLSLSINGTEPQPLTHAQLAAGERLLSLTKIELEGDVNIPILDRKVDTVLTGKVFFDDGDLKKRFPTTARLSGEFLTDSSLTLKVTVPESHPITAAIPITEVRRDNDLIIFTVVSLGAFKDTGPLATRSNELIDEIRQTIRGNPQNDAKDKKPDAKPTSSPPTKNPPPADDE